MANPFAAANPFARAGTGVGIAAVGPTDLELPMPADAGSVQSLSWSPTANVIAAGGWDNVVRVWEVATGSDGRPAATPRTQMDFGLPVLDTCWMEDGVHLFASTAVKAVKVWNVTTTTATDVAAHESGVRACAWIAERKVLVTGGWDNRLCFWDCKGTSPVLTVTLPERVYAMDCKYPVLVVACADRRIYIFNCDAPDKPMRVLESPLRLQTRSAKVFHNRHFFLLGSAEGRAAVRCVDEARDTEKEGVTGDKLKWSFAFKCHRTGLNAFPVNSVDTHPHPDFQSVMATAGADGCFAFWDKDKRTRTAEHAPARGAQALTCGAFNAGGDSYAYAVSYDWHRGVEGFDPRIPNKVYVHAVTEADLRGTA